MKIKASRMLVLLLAASVGSVCAQRAEYLPLELLEPPDREGGIRVWKFDVFPSASVGGEYDDNPTYMPGSGRSEDFVWRITPGFSAVAGASKRLSLSYSPSAQIYTKNSDYNAVNHSAGLTLVWPMTKLSLNFSATYSDTLSSDVMVGGMTRGRTFAATFGATYQYTDKISSSHNLRFSFQDYGNYYGAYAAPAGGFIGFNDWGTDHWLGYSATTKTSFGLGTSFGYQGAQRGGVESMYERIMANAGYRITDKINLSAAIGPEFRQYNGGGSDSMGLTYSLSGSWTPRARTSLSLGANRSQTPSPVNGGENYVNHSVNFGLSQGISDRFTATFGLGYNNISSANNASGVVGGRNDDYLNARFGLAYHFNPRWSASLHYERRQSLADSTSTYGFDNNRFGFSVSWRY